MYVCMYVCTKLILQSIPNCIKIRVGFASFDDNKWYSSNYGFSKVQFRMFLLFVCLTQLQSLTISYDPPQFGIDDLFTDCKIYSLFKGMSKWDIFFLGVHNNNEWVIFVELWVSKVQVLNVFYCFLFWQDSGLLQFCMIRSSTPCSLSLIFYRFLKILLYSFWKKPQVGLCRRS
jgi:hypothetical protein